MPISRQQLFMIKVVLVSSESSRLTNKVCSQMHHTLLDALSTKVTTVVSTDCPQSPYYSFHERQAKMHCSFWVEHTQTVQAKPFTPAYSN